MQRSPASISFGIPSRKEETEVAPVTLVVAFDWKVAEAVVLVKKRTLGPPNGKGDSPRTSLAQNARFACQTTKFLSA